MVTASEEYSEPCGMISRGESESRVKRAVVIGSRGIREIRGIPSHGNSESGVYRAMIVAKQGHTEP